MSSQSQKSQALLSLWGHLVLTSIAKQTHTHKHFILSYIAISKCQVTGEHDNDYLLFDI